MNPIVIIELEENNSNANNALKEFSKNAWFAADKEHYGEVLPNFTRHKFTLLAQEFGTGVESKNILGYGKVAIDTGVAHMESLFVKTELKGKGIGTQLLQAIEEKVKELGAHKIWLETGFEWKAKDFYLKNGYTVRTVLPNHYAHQDSVLMDKMLD